MVMEYSQFSLQDLDVMVIQLEVEDLEEDQEEDEEGVEEEVMIAEIDIVEATVVVGVEVEEAPLQLDVLTVDLIETLHQAVILREVICVIIAINQDILLGIVQTNL